MRDGLGDGLRRTVRCDLRICCMRPPLADHRSPRRPAPPPLLPLTCRDLLQQAGRFPPFPCDNNIGTSPYLLSEPEVVNGQICFTVQVVTPDVVSPCNTMDFYKLILDVQPACAKGISHYFVNGEPRVSPTPETYGTDGHLIKLPQVPVVPQCMQPTAWTPSSPSFFHHHSTETSAHLPLQMNGPSH